MTFDPSEIQSNLLGFYHLSSQTRFVWLASVQSVITVNIWCLPRVVMKTQVKFLQRCESTAWYREKWWLMFSVGWHITLGWTKYFVSSSARLGLFVADNPPNVLRRLSRSQGRGGGHCQKNLQGRTRGQYRRSIYYFTIIFREDFTRAVASLIRSNENCSTLH